jgi:hypothetical protein
MAEKSQTMANKTGYTETTYPNRNAPRKKKEARYQGTPAAATRSPSIAKQTT